ncbi:hypothetical protein L6452_16383 [Arctium lappa]|uniref:Uncharacterized protein n=1 Tax=Arctium lappa TaxID=4217 RepID=A0ACB9C0K6_ARCLA|nr:hypothetical protein L6452_16383 [Arctium lappa]
MWLQFSFTRYEPWKAGVILVIAKRTSVGQTNTEEIGAGKSHQLRRRCRFQRIKMVGGRVAHPVLKGPSVVKELIIGSVLGLAAGGLWKMHHWNEQRKTRAFYDLLEKGEISVVVQE